MEGDKSENDVTALLWHRVMAIGSHNLFILWCSGDTNSDIIGG